MHINKREYLLERTLCSAVARRIKTKIVPEQTITIAQRNSQNEQKKSAQPVERGIICSYKDNGYRTSMQAI